MQRRIMQFSHPRSQPLSPSTSLGTDPAIGGLKSGEQFFEKNFTDGRPLSIIRFMANGGSFRSPNGGSVKNEALTF